VTIPARPSLTAQQRFDWLRLIRTETIGPRTFRTLLNQFGSARAALEALPELARKRGRPIAIPGEGQIEGELRTLDRMGARLVASVEEFYPEPLAAIEAAPPLIAVKGDPSVLARPAVALVGSRNSSALGQRLAATLAKDLAGAGFVIVSGLARGIDAAAHRVSLQSGTVAVLAGGFGRIYPAEHAALADSICETGCLVSEMPVDWTATGRDFPRRNRIVSGLSYGTIVVEAALRSGSLITARFANEQGREVFAVPGSPLDPRSEGTNRLIRNGATLITSAQDVLEALQPLVGAGPPRKSPLREDGAEADNPLWDEWDDIAGPAPRARSDLVPDDGPRADRERLIALLGPSPVSTDDLVRSSGLAAGAVHLILLELDLAGRITRHGENRVSIA
jgi:DNA processing protein